jgi:hypothetical protein
VGDNPLKLGVCKTHFNLDHNSVLHPIENNFTKPISSAMIVFKRCLHCGHNFGIYSRGKFCKNHTWNVIGKNLQTSCVCQFNCPSFTNEISFLSEKIKDDINYSYRSRYICQTCYHRNGGHYYKPPGRGKKTTSCKEKHEDDPKEVLNKIGKFIIDVANSDDNDSKQRLLSKLTISLASYWKKDSVNNFQQTSPNLPSLFLINTIFKLQGVDKLNEEKKGNLSPNDSFNYGELLGKYVLKCKEYIKEHNDQLTNPSSLTEYYEAFPQAITRFFNGFIGILLKHHHDFILKKRNCCSLEQHLSQTKDQKLDQTHLIKITTFLSSIIFTIAFRRTKFWLTSLLASLCRRTHYLGYLQSILNTVYITAHSEDRECRLEKKRMEVANPKTRLQFGPNIWNLAIVDNIDLKQIAFKYGNIYDFSRNTLHATLRMVFQFNLPTPIFNITDTRALMLPNGNRQLLGYNAFSIEVINKFEFIFKKLLQYENDSEYMLINQIDDVYIHEEILKYMPKGTFVAPPNVVILEAGKKPNDNEDIFETCERYLDDIELVKNKSGEYLHIASDESIFRRIVKYSSHINSNCCPILGQWHTNKDMCSVLINIFSGYGIFNLAEFLGAKFLSNFQKVVDYRATCKVLELIWVAIGISLQIYSSKHQTSIDNLLKNSTNKILKAWILYWKWASLWKCHKLGIRMGNWDMQMESLSAFAPLFPVAGKLNYSTSVCHYLALIDKNPQLASILRLVSSVNLTRVNHYLAFDEALETYGVKFIKQSLTRKPMDIDSLYLQIKSAQAEQDRIKDLLYDFVDINDSTKLDHNVASRRESIWNLVDELLDLFECTNLSSDHKLLKMSPELNNNGFELLFNCYSKGKKRMEVLLRQEVYKTEDPNPTGRKLRNVNIYKYDDLQKLYKNKKKTFVSLNPTNNNNNNFMNIDNSTNTNITAIGSSNSINCRSFYNRQKISKY